MKFIKLDLLTLLISLFLFASCESTSTIGLEVDPNSAVQGALVDTITINSRTILDDITSTNGAVRNPLGYLKDPTFGTTESSLAMTVNLPYANYNFGTLPVLDSAVLVMNYGGEFYGDSTATYSFDIHQLSDNISGETSFLSSRNWNYSPTLIGSKSAKIYPKTPLKITDIVVGKADTLKTVTPQVRIKLDNSFVTSNVININSDNLKSDANFARFLGGLHVSINKTTSTGNGGVMFFEFTGTTSGLYLYYKKQNISGTTSTIDTVAVNFPISNATNPVASTIKHNYTGTAIATQLANPNTQYSTTYLQPLAGLRNKISFPHLGKFSTNVGKVAVNKAELVIDLSSGSDVIPFSAAPRLSLYRYDIAEKRQNLPDNNVGTQSTSGDTRALSPAVFGGYFNTVTKQYVFVVTSYIQDLLDGKLIDYGTFLAPTPTSEFQFSPSISTGARSIIGSFKKTPAAGDNIMKLNIYYTKIN